MKSMISTLMFLLIASIAGGASVLPVNITVKEKAGGKIVKRLTTAADGGFALGALPAGVYTLEFRGKKSAALMNQQFLIAIDGIKKSGIQGGAPGDSLVGGVALNVEVASLSKVTGQVTFGANVAINSSGKKMVWVPKQLGSNLPGHWVVAGSAETAPAHNVVLLRTDDLRKWQDHGDTSAATLLEFIPHDGH